MLSSFTRAAVAAAVAISFSGDVAAEQHGDQQLYRSFNVVALDFSPSVQADGREQMRRAVLSFFGSEDWHALRSGGECNLVRIIPFAGDAAKRSLTHEICAPEDVKSLADNWIERIEGPDQSRKKVIWLNNGERLASTTQPSSALEEAHRVFEMSRKNGLVAGQYKLAIISDQLPDGDAQEARDAARDLVQDYGTRISVAALPTTTYDPESYWSIIQAEGEITEQTVFGTPSYVPAGVLREALNVDEITQGLNKAFAGYGM